MLDTQIVSNKNISYSKALCLQSHKTKSVFPSLDSFQKRMELPKVYYLFYDYFFKGVMGDDHWENVLGKSGESASVRLGSSVAEAFAHLILENNYFA